MKKTARHFLTVMILLIGCNAFSQEFKISVSVSTVIQGTDRQIYENLQNLLNDFVNSRKWTNYNYQMQEKIEGNITLTIKQRPSQDFFQGDLSIQLRRPVYNSSYFTTILNTIEQDFAFKYQEGESLEYDQNTYYNNLVSTVSFYLYYFLALDGDSFAQGGGIPYFQICQNIVNASQRSGQSGWKSFENQKNKYWICENYNNATYRKMHDVWYQYHLLGMDLLAGDNQAEARNNILLALENLQKVNREKSQLICVQQFVDAKADEIVSIFKNAPANEQDRVITIMKEINPANTTKYEQIKQVSNNVNDQFNSFNTNNTYNNNNNFNKR
jgi:hypothetical protein